MRVNEVVVGRASASRPTTACPRLTAVPSAESEGNSTRTTKP